MVVSDGAEGIGLSIACALGNQGMNVVLGDIDPVQLDIALTQLKADSVPAMGVPYAGAYTATQTAVVGMSESWYAELKPHNIEVSVLCPVFVRTRINLSERNRQPDYVHEDQEREIDSFRSEALNVGELYIFTHPNYRPLPRKTYE